MEEAVSDIRLVWSNCMIYNQDGSEYYHLADTFARKFEETYAQLRKMGEENDPERIPSVDERLKLSYDIFKIENYEMGHVLTLIEKSCPSALSRRVSEDEVLVNIDSLTPACFHEVGSRLNLIAFESLQSYSFYVYT